MPELPEVQTIKTQLETKLPLSVYQVKKSQHFKTLLKDQTATLKAPFIIEKIYRHGKWMGLHLSNQRVLIIHLGMSGKMLISSTPSTQKHNHLILIGEHKRNKMNENLCFNYIDPRRFGRFYYYTKKEADTFFNQMGYDLLSPLFTSEYFKNQLLKFPNRKVKVSLLDQSLFAGIGNYMASEICAYGKVLPTRIVNSLSNKEVHQLYLGIQTVLHHAVDKGGTTFQGAYQDAFGNKGEGVQGLVVFHQTLCRLCQKTPVTKIVLAQRGTYFCSHCQK